MDDAAISPLALRGSPVLFGVKPPAARGEGFSPLFHYRGCGVPAGTPAPSGAARSPGAPKVVTTGRHLMAPTIFLNYVVPRKRFDFVRWPTDWRGSRINLLAGIVSFPVEHGGTGRHGLLRLRLATSCGYFSAENTEPC